MKRLAMFSVLVATVAASAYAQRTSSSTASDIDLRMIPVEELHGFDLYQEQRQLGSLADLLSEEQFLMHLSRLYSYQARILHAQAEGQTAQVERLLDLAMIEIGMLANQPNMIERPKYRELYRSVVVEFEAYFGAMDGDEYGSVFAVRDEIFQMHERLENPLAEDASLPTMAPIETSVPMTENRIVKSTIDYFLAEKRDVIIRWMDRADTYFPMIEQILREEGVPDELKYLAVVESGLNPRARSSAKAVGMWQFIYATGTANGLNVTTWVDERMDPEKATRAAARHLRDLYVEYGEDWHVALAGYNCSPRCIKRAMSQAGGSTKNPPSYWDMYNYLPRETRGFVPQFIAFALIMSNPTAFGLPARSSGHEYAYEVVRVTGMLSIADIADMLDVGESTIKALNPELRRGTLPPGSSPYPLRIPLDSYERFAEAFERLPEEAKRPAAEYVVKRGDSLGKIARRFGISLNALMASNNLRRTRIYPGQHLVVPADGYNGTITLVDARPERVEYGRRINRPIAFNPGLAKKDTSVPVVQARLTPTSQARTRATVTYQVRRGDNLSSIASKYGTTVRAIKARNGLSSDKIKAGQTLTILRNERGTSTVVHVVSRGESLGRIASKYGTSVSALKRLNGLRSNTIHPDQRLNVGQNQANVVHTVRRGEYLGHIASKYGTTVSAIKRLNNLRSSTIHPGQRLKIDP